MTQPDRPLAKTDRVHDVLRGERHSLVRMFRPRSVAVIGATEAPGSVGRTLLFNLVSSPFGGTIYPVNPKRSNVLGIRAYPSIKEVPDPIDLAVVVTPAPTVPGVIGECAEAGIGNAIIISAGFKELGADGQALEQQILERARTSGMRIVGPNCLGVMNPMTGLNATFAHGTARPGRIAFVSQSGALCTAILDWSLAEQVGFSAFVSIGSMMDVSWGDLIDYLGDDHNTQAILLYMESIGDARSFLSSAREVALSKPIIVIKAGRTPAAAKAAASHTGSLAGSDAVLDAAFKRAGVLRVDTIEELFGMAEVLAKQPRPKGPRLTIVTNAGGPGVLATDALLLAGGRLAEIDPSSMGRLNEVLPAAWSHGNPIDILGDGTPDRFAQSVDIVSKDPNSDGMLVILTPQDMTEPTQTAERLKGFALGAKPLLASWMGGPMVRAGEDILNRAGIPTFAYPDAAAKAFADMWRYAHNLEELYETPLPSAAGDAPIRREEAEGILERARKAGRRLLDEVESKQVLAAYAIPVVSTQAASTADEAVQYAQKIGYPVVLKLRSATITHKSDVGGVALDLRDDAMVRAAFDSMRSAVTELKGPQDFLGVSVQTMVRGDGYELILGSSLDEQFGPIILFGHGGTLVETLKDSAVALPPLTATLARRLICETRISKAFNGIRGRKALDMGRLEQILVRFSQLVVEQPWIAECDINPLLVSADQMVALDARILLHDPARPRETLPRPAIRPYPTQYTRSFALRNGTAVRIRMIRPEDEPAMVRFHRKLSEQTVRLRYFHPLQYTERVAHERLVRICFSDYDRDLALVAELEQPSQDGERDIIAVGRLSKLPGKNRGEFALLVGDQWQGQGLGTELLTMIVQVARDEKLSRVGADILPENVEMQGVARKAGFSLDKRYDEQRFVAELALTP